MMITIIPRTKHPVSFQTSRVNGAEKGSSNSWIRPTSLCHAESAPFPSRLALQVEEDRGGQDRRVSTWYSTELYICERGTDRGETLYGQGEYYKYHPCIYIYVHHLGLLFRQAALFGIQLYYTPYVRSKHCRGIIPRGKTFSL